MFKLSRQERNVCHFLVVLSNMFYEKTMGWFNKDRLFEICSQQVFSSALVRTAFVIRTTGFSHPHQFVPSHRLKSTVLADLTNILSFNKQSLFAQNLVKTTKRRIQNRQSCFSSKFCIMRVLRWCEFFVSGKLNIKYRFFSFSFFFL